MNEANLRKSAMRSFRAFICAVPALAAWGATIPGAGSPTNVVEITRRLTYNERQKAENLQEFSVLRRYVLHNSRLGRDAVLTARLSYRKGQGKSYEIVQAESAQGLSRRVIERVLQAEVEASAADGSEEASITPDHYDFALLGTSELNGRPCFVLELRPKKKSKFLIQGKAWVDAQEFGLAKLEGRPSASVSMWVGKPFITQEFQKHGDFWMASRNRSQSESRLLGNSELSIEFTDYEVKGVEGRRVAGLPRNRGTIPTADQ